ncbi:hypothetical protein V6N13_048699 [Hibiscus sabdariffa]
MPFEHENSESDFLDSENDHCDASDEVCDGPVHGFKNHCRPFISANSCFLKGYHQGYLLADVGIDANDCIYPIAVVVVEAETRDSWSWFLKLLAEDLDIVNSHHLTLISDKQKVLAIICWGKRYEVAFGPFDQHVVNLQTRGCSCRKCGLTGQESMLTNSSNVTNSSSCSKEVAW